MNRERGKQMGISDMAWVWLESQHGKIRCQVKLMEGCNPDTVWTWNAIGKQSGAWGLSDKAPESQKGFLMNHLISELLPAQDGERGLTNSDPVTGQAAWYDLKVNVYLAAPDETGVYPQFDTIKPLPDMQASPAVLTYHTHPPINLERSMQDALKRGHLGGGDKT